MHPRARLLSFLAVAISALLLCGCTVEYLYHDTSGCQGEQDCPKGFTCSNKKCVCAHQVCNEICCRAGDVCDGAQRCCQPRTCTQMGQNCGLWSDGCGSSLVCGPTCRCSFAACDGLCCQAGEVCDPANTCCKPKTCSDLGLTCGVGDNGCGNALNCGPTCACNLSGTPKHETKLVGANASWFGLSLAVNGSYGLAGAPGRAGTNQKGSVFALQKIGGAWQTKGELIPGTEILNPNEAFGLSVSISGDWAAVGGEGNRLFLFLRSGDTWGYQQTLNDPEPGLNPPNLHGFGEPVFMAGEFLMVGAHNKTTASGIELAGAVYVYQRTGSNWVQKAKLEASDPERADTFGQAISTDGSYAIVGTHWKNQVAGAAYVFERTGDAWAFKQKLTASDALANDYFGSSVSLRGDTAVVGASQFGMLPTPGSKNGKVYVFQRVTNGTWSEVVKLPHPDGLLGSAFGLGLALQDGTLAVSASYENDYTGAVYLYRGSGATWTRSATLRASDAAKTAFFGDSPTISLTDCEVLIGNSYKDALYVYAF